MINIRRLNSSAPDFAARLAVAVQKLRVGDGLKGPTDQGPLINMHAVEKVEEHIADAIGKGARVVMGGKRHALGHSFFQPTVIADTTPDMLVAHEETFGPLAPLFRFKTDAEAIALANDTEFGLASYFYSRDIGRIWRVGDRVIHTRNDYEREVFNGDMGEIIVYNRALTDLELADVDRRAPVVADAEQKDEAPGRCEAVERRADPRAGQQLVPQAQLLGERAALRLRIPPQPIHFHDLVHGAMEFSHEVIGDPVLVRAGPIWGSTFHPELTDDDRALCAWLQGVSTVSRR